MFACVREPFPVLPSEAGRGSLPEMTNGQNGEAFPLLEQLSDSARLVLQKSRFAQVNGQSASMQAIAHQSATVFLFQSTDCPLCQKYTLPLKEIAAIYSPKNIKIYAVFLPEYDSVSEIKKYLHKYELPFDALIDHNRVLTRLLRASVTPEVVVIDSCYQKIYQGAIDNWYYALGKRRTLVTQRYLSDVLDAMCRQELPKITCTKAVGCFIGTDKLKTQFINK